MKFTNVHQEIAAATLMLCCAAATGCGAEPTLTESSTCREFLAATRGQQDRAVATIAQDVGSPNAVTPLGRPNVDFYCAQAPDMTLGHAIGMIG